MDRRIKKTRRAIYGALHQLLSEKSLTDISVQEIADCADINRVTFYSHFNDKQDAMRSYCKDFASYLLEEDTLNENRNDRNLHRFRRINENRETFQLLSDSRNVQYFDNALIEWSRANVARYYIIQEDDISGQVRKDILAYAFVAVIKWYGMHCTEVTPEQMTHIYADHMPKKEI